MHGWDGSVLADEDEADMEEDSKKLSKYDNKNDSNILFHSLMSGTIYHRLIILNILFLLKYALIVLFILIVCYYLVVV